MNKKLILIIFVLFSSFVYAPINPLGTLTMNGLSIPDPNSMLYEQIIGNNPQFLEMMNFANQGQAIITNPSAFLLAQGQTYIDPKYEPLIQVSNDFVNYAQESGIVDYNLPMSNDGVIENGKIKYEKTDVALNGIIPKEDGKFEYNKDDASVTIGKNTYTGVEANKSNLVVDSNGDLISADLTVKKSTTMYFGDRAYNVQPGTKINYTLIKEGDKEYYEITVKSKEEVEFSFPNLDEQGIPIGNKNYKINGDASFTEEGVEIYKGTTLTDTNLGFKIKNNGDDSILVTDSINKVGDRTNYIMANEDDFRFKLKESELNFIKSKNDMYNMNLKDNEELKINFDKDGGSGYLYAVEDGTTVLKNTGGEFTIEDPRCGKREMGIEIIARFETGEKCIINYQANDITIDGENAQVCKKEPIEEKISIENPTGKSVLSFLMIEPPKITGRLTSIGELTPVLCTQAITSATQGGTCLLENYENKYDKFCIEKKYELEETNDITSLKYNDKTSILYISEKYCRNKEEYSTLVKLVPDSDGMDILKCAACNSKVVGDKGIGSYPSCGKNCKEGMVSESKYENYLKNYVESKNLELLNKLCGKDKEILIKNRNYIHNKICGDEIIETGEQCEFYKNGNKINKNTKSNWFASNNPNDKQYENENNICNSKCEIVDKSVGRITPSTETDCGNNQDDDIDTYTDCEDSDCVSDLLCIPKSDLKYLMDCKEDPKDSKGNELCCGTPSYGPSQWQSNIEVLSCRIPIGGGSCLWDGPLFSSYYITINKGNYVLIYFDSEKGFTKGGDWCIKGGIGVFSISEAITKECYTKCNTKCSDCIEYMLN